MGEIITGLVTFAIICVVLVFCMCRSSTNWRNESHDYEYEEVVKRNKENKQNHEK